MQPVRLPQGSAEDDHEIRKKTRPLSGTGLADLKDHFDKRFAEEVADILSASECEARLGIQKLGDSFSNLVLKHAMPAAIAQAFMMYILMSDDNHRKRPGPLAQKKSTLALCCLMLRSDNSSLHAAMASAIRRCSSSGEPKRDACCGCLLEHNG